MTRLLAIDTLVSLPAAGHVTASCFRSERYPGTKTFLLVFRQQDQPFNSVGASRAVRFPNTVNFLCNIRPSCTPHFTSLVPKGPAL